MGGAEGRGGEWQGLINNAIARKTYSGVSRTVCGKQAGRPPSQHHSNSPDFNQVPKKNPLDVTRQRSRLTFYTFHGSSSSFSTPLNPLLCFPWRAAPRGCDDSWNINISSLEVCLQLIILIIEYSNYLNLSLLFFSPNELKPCVTGYKHSGHSLKKKKSFVKLFAHLAHGAIHLSMAGEQYVELHLGVE